VVDRLEVRWPNGLEEAWTRLPVDQIVNLKEGSGKPFRSKAQSPK
jgi:hypothetical protein